VSKENARLLGRQINRVVYDENNDIYEKSWKIDKNLFSNRAWSAEFEKISFYQFSVISHRYHYSRHRQLYLSVFLEDGRFPCSLVFYLRFPATIWVGP
jgi:hypothetical protein